MLLKEHLLPFLVSRIGSGDIFPPVPRVHKFRNLEIDLGREQEGGRIIAERLPVFVTDFQNGERRADREQKHPRPDKHELDLDRRNIIPVRDISEE